MNWFMQVNELLKYFRNAFIATSVIGKMNVTPLYSASNLLIKCDCPRGKSQDVKYFTTKTPHVQPQVAQSYKGLFLMHGWPEGVQWGRGGAIFHSNAKNIGDKMRYRYSNLSK
jgi:hypothetical protein